MNSGDPREHYTSNVCHLTVAEPVPSETVALLSSNTVKHVTKTSVITEMMLNRSPAIALDAISVWHRHILLIQNQTTTRPMSASTCLCWLSTGPMPYVIMDCATEDHVPRQAKCARARARVCVCGGASLKHIAVNYYFSPWFYPS